MAKSDFCFTYYDGDAARDMAHMNRLERGGYGDIVISQRKFGHLTKDQIKKILGRDFDECFPAIELVLKKDEKGLFFIDWLEQSEKKAKTHSKHQSDKRKGKTKINQTITESNPNETKQQPLEDGNEDVDGNEDWKRWGDQIVNDNDATWQAMRGRKVSREEIDNFLSVATRNDWTMETQQKFRTTLNGFKAINTTTNGKQPNKKQQHTDSLIQAHAIRWGSDAPHHKAVERDS